MSVEVTTRGLKSLVAFFDSLPETAEAAQILAVNEGARFAQVRGSESIRDQVNFSKGYLGTPSMGAAARLGITQRARANDVEAVVRGRERPTSLARFAVGNKSFGKRSPGRPVRVQVSKRGGAKTLPGAWLMRLRSGASLSDENFNVGLAIRLAPGQSINKREFADTFGDFSMQGTKSRFMLLYGPSVAQVFRDVAGDLQGIVSSRVEDEFIRQFERLKK
jgi:hypothetical protein